ncbi:hypothetical protein ACHAXM_002189 [Skeletonema potamos]
MNTTETKANTNNKTSNERRRALAQQLHNAAQVGNIQEIQSIFIKHPELSIDSHRKGNTALHTALYHNQDGLLLDYLLECGASVNSPNSKGYTPLDLSIMYCKGGKAAEKLIGAGAQWKETYCCSDTTNESSKNGGGGGGGVTKLAFEGLTPLDVARKYNHQEVIELLSTRLLYQDDDDDKKSYCRPVVSASSSTNNNRNATDNTITTTLGKWHAICPICNDTVRFPTSMSRILLDQEILESRLNTVNGVLLDSLEKSGSGRNRKKYIRRKYLDQFMTHANGKAYKKLCGITYHAVQNMRLRKEISESMGVLSAVQRCCDKLMLLKGVEGDDGGHNADDDDDDDTTIRLEHVFLIDLCSGRGLTTALGGALHDDNDDDRGDGNSSNNYFLAIDKMLPHTVPHFLQDGGNRKYLSRDVMSETLFAELQEIVSEQLDKGRTPILVGMHLCGVLSERAVEFFERIPSIKGIVLSPCCLPKMHEQKKGMTKFTKGKVDYEFLGSNEESGELYNYFKWSHYLKEKMSRSTPHVTSFTDDEMHTEKNAIVVGIRS